MYLCRPHAGSLGRAGRDLPGSAAARLPGWTAHDVPRNEFTPRIRSRITSATRWPHCRNWQEQEVDARMSLWRVRIALSDDRRSQELLAQAVAGKRVCSRLDSPRGTEITVDMIIELADVSGLGDLLGELHAISSQVLVSSAEQPSSLDRKSVV
jgi:hypothetical protein